MVAVGSILLRHQVHNFHIRSCDVKCSASPVVYVVESATAHNKDGHPENVTRLSAVQQAINQYVDSTRRQEIFSTRTANEYELSLVHPKTYVERIKQICGTLQEATMVDDSTYLAPGSFTACCDAVGRTLDLVDHILTPPSSTSNTVSSSTKQTESPGFHQPSAEHLPFSSSSPDREHRANSVGRSSHPGIGVTSSLSMSQGASAGFALVRPPGHHVLPSRPMGFGVFNTISVAARYAQQRHGIDKILIFDFDVHHGNGTMEVFYEDPSVMYISTHQSGLWPYTGKVNNTGQGPGKGTTINVPLPAGSGEEAVRRVVERVVWPAAKRFKPQLIMASAGYDAHWQDPLASFQFKASTYRYMAEQLKSMADMLCSGKCLFVLEGGYHVDSLTQSIVATIEGLGTTRPSTTDSEAYQQDSVWLPEEPLSKIDRLLDDVCRLHQLQGTCA